MMNKFLCGKWIVHPHSYEKRGYREVSCVRENNEHGIKSYGWDGDDKIVLVSDGQQSPVDDKVIAYAIVLAEEKCRELNKVKTVLTEEQMAHNLKIDEMEKQFYENAVKKLDWSMLEGF